MQLQRSKLKNGSQNTKGKWTSLLERIDYKKFIFPFAVGLLLWFLAPLRPAGIDLAAWQMLAIFVATIIGCVTKPLPIGAVAIIGFAVTVMAGEVKIDDAVAGFGNSSIWLIVMAFFISRGFIKTGLGRRIALVFVKIFGKKTLGLLYSLIGVDLILAPATPSNTARAGGIMYPIINSLSRSFGSNPEEHTERKIGSFLTFGEFHGNTITSAMFMTAMAANPLAQSLAKSSQVNITWMDWFIAALVPGIFSLIVVPFLIYKMYPPKIKKTPNAAGWSQKQLDKMGQMKPAEKWMAVIFVLALILWVLGSTLQIDATLTAFIALALLLLTGVLNWNDILQEKGAWNTLTWFSILVMMANELNELGFIPWLSKSISHSLHGLNWPIVLVILILFYFYSHYLFASATAYTALLGVAMAAGVPPMLGALLLGFFGNLFASTTNYSDGPAPILFSSGYVEQTDWWRLNAVLGIFYLVVWLSLGSLWMKICGFY